MVVRFNKTRFWLSKLVIVVFFSPFAGLSPDLQSMEQIRRIMRPTDVPDQGQSEQKVLNVFAF